MSPRTRTRRIPSAVTAAACAVALIPGPAASAAEPRRQHGIPAVQLEHLDRGLVAATTADGVFLSWRLRGHEVSGRTDTGMAGPAFHVYRDGQRIATVTDSTNHLDRDGTAGSAYQVAAVVGGAEVDLSAEVSPWSGAYHDVPMRKPPDGVTPRGEAYTYSVNDVSVGDVDGDGQYEYVVKWDPSNSKDVSQVGYTGPVYVDTYRLDGTLLHRIDLGVNVRAGAHYAQVLVYDFDGDGRAELMLKTAPGTKVVRYRPDGGVAAERHITMPRQDLAAATRTPTTTASARPATTTTWSRCSSAGTGIPRSWRAAGPRRWRTRSASRGRTPIRCPRPTRGRWPTTSSTCTPRAGARATTCGRSRASSCTGPNT
ncbi:hypothetical protein ACFQZ4_04300 [Catellatospora coxensis]